MAMMSAPGDLPPDDEEDEVDEDDMADPLEMNQTHLAAAAFLPQPSVLDGNTSTEQPSVAVHQQDDSTATTTALVAFLRMEADLADAKAKRLRAQAASLASRFGITPLLQEQYELDPEELPPLDENGVPKYKGKKRGRKPKARKRKANPDRRRRQHTAYTLFVQTVYPQLKQQHPDLPSKTLISMVAKQWGKELTDQEKQEWKMRALATHQDAEASSNEPATTADGKTVAATGSLEPNSLEDDAIAEEDDEEEEDYQVEEEEVVDDGTGGDDMDDDKPRRRASRRRKVA